MKINKIVFVGLGLLLLFLLPVNLSAQQFHCEVESEYGTFFGEAATTGELMPSDHWKIPDVLVLYNPAHKDRMGGVAAVETFNREFINGLDLSLSGSQMWVYPRLVKQLEIPYDETGEPFLDWGILKQSDKSGTGLFAGLRDKYGADVVVLFVSSGGGYGGSLSYAVIGDGSVDTARHEFGHCMAMKHPKASYAVSPCHLQDILCQMGYGVLEFTSKGKRFCDLMGIGCEIGEVVPLFSNPALYYEGTPLGKKDEAENWRTGEIFADAIQGLKEMKFSNPCIPNVHTACLAGGRFAVKVAVKRPFIRAVAQVVSFSDTQASFRLGNLPPIQVGVACTGKKATVTVTAAGIPGPTYFNVLVVDTKYDTKAKKLRFTEYIKQVNKQFKSSPDGTNFNCK